MDYISPPITLENDADLRPIRLLRDWHVDGNLVLHRHTGLLFQIFGDQVPYSVRAIHVCDHRPIPSARSLVRIGKDAIHAFMCLTPDRPQSCASAPTDDFYPF